MRIYLKLSKANEIIPFNYQPYLTGTIHKWIGDENEVHDKLSLYSFSWLQNVDVSKDGISLKDSSFFFIGANDDLLIKRIVKGIIKDPSLCYGAFVTEVQIKENPVFPEKMLFHPVSPIFIKKRIENNDKHILYNDPNADFFLTETLQHKLKEAGLSADGVSVSFVKDYPDAKTKLIKYKTISNKVNFCPVIIEGSPEQIAFAWNVGIGNSTGIGFGALK